MSKDIYYSDSARNAMKAGLDKVADAVKVTLGPKGRNVVIRKNWGAPIVTKDGVTVAKEIVLKDQIEDVGAQLCKQVASKTNDVAGDGTTTATILAQALVSEGMKFVSTGGNPLAVKRGIDKAVAVIVAALEANKQTISLDDKELVEFIATISGNDPEVGNMVADAFIRVGTNGAVTFEPGRGTETTLEVVEGLHFDRGYLSPYFVTDFTKMRVEYDNPLILFWEKRILNPHELLPLLETVAALKKPLVIISEGVEGEALGTLILNKNNGALQAVAITAPGFGERRKALFEDMALLTGGTFFGEELGHKLESVSVTQLGKAKKIIVTKDDTTIVDGNGKKEKIEDHLDNLKKQLAESESPWDKEKLQERIAKISGGIGVIKIGAATESELHEKRYRYEDAISATKAALEAGIVAGGGVALINASLSLDDLVTSDYDENIGINIVRKAIEVPMRTIVSNAGYSGEVVTEKVKDQELDGWGFNAKTGEYGIMLDMGIIDPFKVTKSALENAASIAGIFLSTEAMIVDNPDDKNEAGYNPYGM